jgi:hypothetical protein
MGELHHMFKAYGFDKRLKSNPLFFFTERKKWENCEMNSPAGDEVTDHRSGASSSSLFFLLDV